MYEEQIGPRFAEAIQRAADTSATSFAADLAEKGCKPDVLRLMADRWDDWGFDPPEYAADLRLFANELEQNIAEFPRKD